MSNKDVFVIIGCGGHARSVADVILENNSFSQIIFLDENAKKNETIMNFPVYSKYNVQNEKVIVALGDNKLRTELSTKYYNNLVNVVSKRAYIGKDVTLGKGIFIGHNAFVGTLSIVEDFCIINTQAIVEHENKLGKAVFIAPNATLLGKVNIGQYSFIGAGATLRDNINVCSDCIIGINATVVKDIQAAGIYVGNPARNLKRVK